VLEEVPSNHCYVSTDLYCIMQDFRLLISEDGRVHSLYTSEITNPYTHLNNPGDRNPLHNIYIGESNESLKFVKKKSEFLAIIL